jgi:phosphoglycolate phosphatase-like HAD superfamily hydrolase
VLRHIRLIVFDLDYLVYDCAIIKMQALRQSLISLADEIPENVRLPDGIDAEEGFLAHGFRWIRHLEIGLSQNELEQLQLAYRIHEKRLIESGIGQIHQGIEEFVVHCRQWNIAVALGADASRDYLMAVTDCHQLDNLFQIALCTEEFGSGSADEMLEELIYHAEVHPSETLILGTRPQLFQTARKLDLLTIGCGWGIHRQNGLLEADFQSPAFAQLDSVINEADQLAAKKSEE